MTEKQLKYKLVPIEEFDTINEELEKIRKELKKAKKTIRNQQKSITSLENELVQKDCETRTLCEDFLTLEEDFIEISDICNGIIDISFKKITPNNSAENSSMSGIGTDWSGSDDDFQVEPKKIGEMEV